MRALIAGLSLALTVLSAPAALRAQEVPLTSLDWPPFSGRDLPMKGVSAAVVAEAFAAAGRPVRVDILAWQEAVDAVVKTGTHLGYFPEYHSAELAAGTCHFSNPIGSSPLGFVERKDNPVVWRELAQLAGRRIGTVEGYVNTEEFDRMAAAGALQAVPAADDAANLQRLAAGEIDLAVIDRNVLNYLLTFDEALKPLRGRLQFNARPLEDKKLYVCFRHDAAGEAAKAAFDAGLARIDVPRVQAEALRMLDR